MPTIHPSSFIDADTELADDVVIGPWCCVNGRVKIGAGCRLIGNVHLRGPLDVGPRNTFYPFVCLGFDPQDNNFVSPDGGGIGVALGAENTLREGVTIHAATGQRPTLIGNGNLLMAYSHLGHDVLLGDRCTITNGVLVAGHVQVEDEVTIGGNTGVHQFCRIGRLAMISGALAVTKDVPPFCMMRDSRCVASLNLVGLRRAGLRAHINPLGRAFELLYRWKLSNSTAAERIEQELDNDPLCRELAQFVRTTKRGLTRHVTSHERSDPAI